MLCKNYLIEENKNLMDVSIIIPCYNESSNLSTLIKALEEEIDQMELKYEIVVIDDGSKDDTWQTLKYLASKDTSIKGIRFTRNFGKEAAISAGLRCSSGKAVIVIDADSQHPPELISKMIEIWQKEKIAVVEAVKEIRQKESFLKRLSVNMFYRTFSSMTGFNIKNTSDYKLLDRRVVDAYLSLPEKERFFRALIPWMGFPYRQVYYVPPQRVQGLSQWSFMKLFRLAINAVTSFSSFPLQGVTLLGSITLLISIVLGIQTLYNKLNGRSLEGFTTVILVILFVGSTIMLSLGIIGEYISRIYEEIKSRPGYVVKESIRIENSE